MVEPEVGRGSGGELCWRATRRGLPGWNSSHRCTENRWAWEGNGDFQHCLKLGGHPTSHSKLSSPLTHPNRANFNIPKQLAPKDNWHTSFTQSSIIKVVSKTRSPTSCQGLLFVPPPPQVVYINGIYQVIKHPLFNSLLVYRGGGYPDRLHQPPEDAAIADRNHFRR